MLKKLWMLCLALVLALSAGLAAAVEVNTADQAALESVKGIGPVHAKAIIDERAKNGPFKDADDLATRVKGIGSKSVKNLEAAGLTINGSSAPPSGAKSSKSTAKSTQPSTAATADAAASAPPAASGTKASRSKKKSKAASAPAASGA
jgi:competence protein ComEA